MRKYGIYYLFDLFLILFITQINLDKISTHNHHHCHPHFRHLLQPHYSPFLKRRPFSFLLLQRRMILRR